MTGNLLFMELNISVNLLQSLLFLVAKFLVSWWEGRIEAVVESPRQSSLGHQLDGCPKTWKKPQKVPWLNTILVILLSVKKRSITISDWGILSNANTLYVVLAIVGSFYMNLGEHSFGCWPSSEKQKSFQKSFSCW